MKSLPIVLVIIATVGLGVYLGLLYLRGERRPYLIGLHLLLGAAGLEGFLVMLQQSEGTAHRLGTYAAGLFAVGMMAGFIAPVLAKRSKKNGEVVLVTHASLGAAGFLFFLAWVANL